MSAAARFHLNGALAGGAGAPDWAARLPAVLADVRAAVAAAAPDVGGSTVYTGSAGVAYALARAARADPSLLPLAVQQAAAAAGRARDLRRRVPESVLDGQAGVAMVEALVARAADPAAPLDGPLSRFAACCARAADPGVEASDEVLYGRSGALLGALALNAQLGSSTVSEATLAALCRAILNSGRRLSAQLRLAERGGPPLFYTWPEGGGLGDEYLGAAHGLAGIAHALLNCWRLLPSVDAAAQADVLGTLDYIMSLEASVPGGATRGGHWPVMCRLGWRKLAEDGEPILVHWCHGSPGIAMVMSKAYEVTGDERFKAAAVSAGELVWERGLLTKGPGLCHGISGNAYALLSVWRATRDPAWLARAQRFAAFIGEPGPGGGRGDWRAPDHPYSLFEGLGGGLCLLIDLIVNPGSARFPFFEVP